MEGAGVGGWGRGGQGRRVPLRAPAAWRRGTRRALPAPRGLGSDSDSVVIQVVRESRLALPAPRGSAARVLDSETALCLGRIPMAAGGRVICAARREEGPGPESESERERARERERERGGGGRESERARQSETE